MLENCGLEIGVSVDHCFVFMLSLEMVNTIPQMNLDVR